jgi:hypothetical protein
MLLAATSSFADPDGCDRCGSLGQQGLVTRIRCPLAGIDDIMPGIPQGAYGRRHDIRIGQDAHAIRRRS